MVRQLRAGARETSASFVYIGHAGKRWLSFETLSFTPPAEPTRIMSSHSLRSLCALLFTLILVAPTYGGTTTWDGKNDTSRIEVTVVYFVPADRQSLPDWKDRVQYYARRLEQFHAREFGDQSKLTVTVHPEPFVSKETTETLREGDANKIYFRTLSEVDRTLAFAQNKPEERDAFPILLVLSEINWRPLDDFYRLHPEGGKLVFEGNLNQGQHFPGATSGGARAAYLANRGVGWGLVSGDGWRVPYRGTDCVVYHEGCGHTVGLPHPEPGNGSVMSMGQYRGWISESWLDKEQKSRMGWEPASPESLEDKSDEPSLALELFTRFRAIPEPMVPKPNQDVRLKLDWPAGVQVKSLRVRYQTAIDAPWIDVPNVVSAAQPETVSLGRFDREIPISYRVDAELHSGETAEIWGYLQVRSEANQNPLPRRLSDDLFQTRTSVISGDSSDSGDTSDSKVIAPFPANAVDLLSLIDPSHAFTTGEWTKRDGKLESSKGYGVRIELPYTPPAEYRIVAIVEPLDPPDALLFGLRASDKRFAALFNYGKTDVAKSAIENIDNKNVGNQTTFSGNLFKQNQMSQVVVEVRGERVQMSVDGHRIVDWQGDASRLSLSDYWSTPNDQALMLGCYDCRYRFHRITLEPIRGKGSEHVQK
ncbi:hypothetical protein GCM10023156_66970 [Novipirellula rosea]|uniref:Uncharacterized protein n=2 Tax=Novipirellula rosea TaxID=1031540 RepID=A0ABP8NRS5_9BACT